MIKKLLLITFVSVLSSNIYSMGSGCDVSSFLSKFSKEEQIEQLSMLKIWQLDKDTVAYLRRLLERLKKEVSEN
ncbi:hypothetical protein KJ644_03350 [Candidatus Dependentiae bacterium]|nr:hypothetical protein [Candidatus Dependentiae bacterium]MBU4387482.1 hypothetical protein [Candidatus Dependentiae bacterium]MCG2756491.1 hypothetical protein [Candidatus Dependentiae bacterium]